MSKVPPICGGVQVEVSRALEEEERSIGEASEV